MRVSNIMCQESVNSIAVPDNIDTPVSHEIKKQIKYLKYSIIMYIPIDH